MKHCNLFLLALILLLTTAPSMAAITETFENTDINTLKADVSKYFLSQGAQISHGDSYESNTLQAVDRVIENRNIVTRNFVFNFSKEGSGSKLDMTMYKTILGSRTQRADISDEQEFLEKLKASMKGKFLYGLGFEFEVYNTEKGKIRAPKGKQNGIKLTAAKYDAQAKGLKAGDVIVEIDGTKTKDMPMEEYANALFAKSLTDTLTLKIKRGSEYKTVTLTPRASNRKVF